MKNQARFAILIVVFASMFFAVAGTMDKPGGIRVGNRMLINPYASISYTYDSNIGSSREKDKNSSGSVQFGASFNYRAEKWSLSGSVYGQYHFYDGDYKDEMENFGFGESANWSYSNMEGGKGWSMMISESYSRVLQDDDMTESEGRGIGRDREQVAVSAAVNRRFNEHWHCGINGSFYYLDFDNDVKKYTPLYGWGRYTVGGEVGYTASKWTDFFVSASYQGYNQDNDKPKGEIYDPNGTDKGKNYDSDSWGYQIHAGFGTYLTERINYRIGGGVSHFDYAGEDESDGFTYEITANWSMVDRWNLMLIATSYYQPSERDYGSSIRTDSVGLGVAHALIRGKLNATIDLNYRHEESEYSSYAGADYDTDIITARVGLSYTLNRFASIYGNLEYQNSNSDGSSASGIGSTYDYDRWRATIGLRLQY